MIEQSYRVEVEYRVRRVVYLSAEDRDQARARAQDTTNWEDALDPHELVGLHDRITVKSAKVER